MVARKMLSATVLLCALARVLASGTGAALSEDIPAVHGGAGAVAPAFAYPGDTPAGSWVVTFSDDFEGDALNASNWNVRTNESHCAPCEPELYVPSALGVANGSLLVTTARAHVVGPGGQVFNFTSGWVDTEHKFAQRFGLFEAQAILPPQNATGIWPAFWTMPANESICWPMGGEIDVFEYTANPFLNGVFGSYRWGTQCDVDKQPLPGAMYPPLGDPPIDWSAGPHVFAVTWNATALTFFVDGVAYETKTADEVIMPDGLQYVILDTAIAWYFPPGPDAVYPAITVWDWVRVFTWQAA